MEAIHAIQTKRWWVGELRSHVITVASMFVSFVAVDGYELLFALYNGNWEVITLDAIGFLVIRSIVKTVLTLSFPRLFPPQQAQPNA